MAGFHEIVLDSKYGYGFSGGPMFDTDVTTLKNQREQRNQNNEVELRKWDIQYDCKNEAQRDALALFFRNRRGKAYGFRFLDPFDSKSCANSGTPAASDQLIGIGDGVTAAFQLKKVYTDAVGSYDYYIYKPIDGTVLVQVNGVVKTLGVHFTLDVTTGIITFTGGNIPANTHEIKAGFRYHTPMRFDTDHMQMTSVDHQADSWNSVPIIEYYPF